MKRQVRFIRELFRPIRRMLESQIALALVYLQLDRDGKAEDIFKQLLDQPEWQSQASFYLGKIEEKREHTKKALAWFDKVTDGPFVFESAISAISLLVKDKKFDEADSRLNLLSESVSKTKAAYYFDAGRIVWSARTI